MKTQCCRTGLICICPKLAMATALLLPGMAALDNQPAYGCSCMRPEAAAIERDRATAVFAGEVSRITPTDWGYTVDVTVSDQWKGNIGETVSFTTASDSAACGYYFEIGQAYLVYAHGEATDLSVNLCSRTAPLDNAGADIVELDTVTPAQPFDGTPCLLML